MHFSIFEGKKTGQCRPLLVLPVATANARSWEKGAPFVGNTLLGVDIPYPTGEQLNLFYKQVRVSWLPVSLGHFPRSGGAHKQWPCSQNRPLLFVIEHTVGFNPWL